MQAQKESIPDRASVHVKKDDQVRPEKAKLRLGGRKSLNRRVTYWICAHTLPDSCLCLHEKLSIIV